MFFLHCLFYQYYLLTFFFSVLRKAWYGQDRSSLEAPLMRLKRHPFLIIVHWFRYRVQNGVGRFIFLFFSRPSFLVQMFIWRAFFGFQNCLLWMISEFIWHSNDLWEFVLLVNRTEKFLTWWSCIYRQYRWWFLVLSGTTLRRIKVSAGSSLLISRSRIPQVGTLGPLPSGYRLVDPSDGLTGISLRRADG